MQGKDLILFGALGGLGYIVYKWWENTKSTAPVSTQQTTNATGQSIASANVGGGITTSTACPPTTPGCVTSPMGVVLRVPGMHRRPVMLPPSSFTAASPYASNFAPSNPGLVPVTTNPSFTSPFAHGGSTRPLGHISPSIGFGIRRAANIFPLGIERRIIY